MLYFFYNTHTQFESCADLSARGWNWRIETLSSLFLLNMSAPFGGSSTRCKKGRTMIDFDFVAVLLDEDDNVLSFKVA